VNGRARLDRALDERDQAVLHTSSTRCSRIRPKPWVFDLDGDRNDRLGGGMPATNTVLTTADIGLVDLDQADQSLRWGRTIAVR